MKRVFLIVLDSVGIGELPDAAAYGDSGSNTLLAAAQSPYLKLPNLCRLGLSRIDGQEAFAALCEREGKAVPTQKRLMGQLDGLQKLPEEKIPRSGIGKLPVWYQSSRCRPFRKGFRRN